MSEAWQNTDGQQVNRGYSSGGGGGGGGNPTFGSRNFNNSNFNRGPRRDGAVNGGGYQGLLQFLKNKYFFYLMQRYRTISVHFFVLYEKIFFFYNSAPILMYMCESFVIFFFFYINHT